MTSEAYFINRLREVLGLDPLPGTEYQAPTCYITLAGSYRIRTLRPAPLERLLESDQRCAKATSNHRGPYHAFR